MFGDPNSKIILQYNGKEITIRNTEIDMNFVKKGCRESNGELQGPRLCTIGNSPSFKVLFMALCPSVQQSFISEFVSFNKKRQLLVFLISVLH